MRYCISDICFLACGNDASEPSIIGRWQWASGYDINQGSSPWFLTLDFFSDGTVIRTAEHGARSLSGTWSIDGNRLGLAFRDTTWENDVFTFTIQSDTLTLTKDDTPRNTNVWRSYTRMP
ncbi:MAG: hypothetical protein FWE34_09375 [Defluviitaleaceae bacterium]|nr:hypothetical protein [Defluviitaleaceae bacterium]